MEPCPQSKPGDIQRAVEGTVSADVTNGDEVVLLPGTYSAGNDAGAGVQISDAIDVAAGNVDATPAVARWKVKRPK